MSSQSIGSHESLAARSVVQRHVHAAPYAAVVLAGGYEEAGEGGRWRVAPGEVLVHAAFCAHQDRVGASGARVLNLPVSRQFAGASRAGRIADPDALARLAERDPRAAAQWLAQVFIPGDAGCADAPDLFAQALAGEAAGVLHWADGQGVDRTTAFRWFRGAYGVSPTRFRVEARARLAWRLIVDAPVARSLADIAVEAGFADQAHMSRDVRRLTGRPPGAWRPWPGASQATGAGTLLV